MVRQLPPLNSLRAFEATARHLSFSKAAGELAVTPAALSHQIRGLEERLGLELFQRRARGIELTEAAQLIYPGIHAAFETMAGALQRLERIKLDTILVISATPGFTVKWLVPRLQHFIEAHPRSTRAFRPRCSSRPSAATESTSLFATSSMRFRAPNSMSKN
jgi:LysR family glycine cleavage system transcriptional activator